MTDGRRLGSDVFSPICGHSGNVSSQLVGVGQQHEKGIHVSAGGAEMTHEEKGEQIDQRVEG